MNPLKLINPGDTEAWVGWGDPERGSAAGGALGHVGPSFHFCFPWLHGAAALFRELCPRPAAAEIEEGK